MCERTNGQTDTLIALFHAAAGGGQVFSETEKLKIDNNSARIT